MNAAHLVQGLKKIANFEISVAGYPEKHPASADEKADRWPQLIAHMPAWEGYT